MTNLELQRLVTFLVLMEGHGGIINKAPSYIAEKWESCSNRDSEDSLLGLLDSNNASSYREYMKYWRLG
jgi:hypothetical protein